MQARKVRGDYAIWRQGHTWIVTCAGETVHMAESKAECLEWVKEACA